MRAFSRGRPIQLLCFPEKKSTFAPLQDGGPPARDLPRSFDRASANPDASIFRWRLSLATSRLGARWPSLILIFR